MKYKTDLEGLEQQEIISSLPKAIQSSIAHHRFFDVVKEAYLFKGVSDDLLFQLVITLFFHHLVVLKKKTTMLVLNTT
jgi:hypothetical protein